MAEQEKSYKIAETKDGTLLIVITFRGAQPENPVIFYDGGDHALFHRSHEISVILDYIHPAVRKKLTKQKTVTVIEEENDVVMTAYEAPLQMKPMLPIKKSELETLNEEQSSLLEAMLSDFD